jgi:spermidine synthase
MFNFGSGGSMSRAFKLTFVLAIAAVVSFCGMGYELLVIRLLSGVSGDSVFSQSATAGCFLLALGFGAFLYGRWIRSFSWLILIRVETALSIIAVVSLPIISMMSIYVTSKPRLILYSQLITFVIGTLSGFELPALMDAAKGLTNRWFGSVLAANYFGALAASIAIPLWLLPMSGIYFCGWSLALLSSMVACGVFFRRASFKPQIFWAPLALSIFLPSYAARYQGQFEQFYLKSFYYAAPASFTLQNLRSTLLTHQSLPTVRRFSTPYQDIDIVKDDFRIFGYDSSENFHLFIDQHKQFGSVTETIYHDTIIHGGINLAAHVPEEILIIGGGDGLMVRELLKYPEVKAITLVELDPEMIHLAKDYAPLRQLNADSLRSTKVKIEIADGFTYMRDQSKTFDAIFIDLPHPISTDLSRLYSFEFYSFVIRRLKPHGFMILDFPFDGIVKSSPPGSNNREAARHVYSAIQQAGFSSNAVFGSWETFLIARAEPSQFHFDYETLSPHVKDASVFNLTLMNLHEPVVTPNTIFKPITLKPANGGS